MSSPLNFMTGLSEENGERVMVSIFPLSCCQNASMRPGLSWSGHRVPAHVTYSYLHAVAYVLSPSWWMHPPPFYLNPTQAFKAQCKPLACGEVLPEDSWSEAHSDWTATHPTCGRLLACSVNTCEIPPSLQHAYMTLHCGLATKACLVSLD